MQVLSKETKLNQLQWNSLKVQARVEVRNIGLKKNPKEDYLQGGILPTIEDLIITSGYDPEKYCNAGLCDLDTLIEDLNKKFPGDSATVQ